MQAKHGITTYTLWSTQVAWCKVISTTQLRVKTNCEVSGWIDYLNSWLFLSKNIVWITVKITQKFGLFLPTGFYSVALFWILAISKILSWNSSVSLHAATCYVSHCDLHYFKFLVMQAQPTQTYYVIRTVKVNMK